MKERGAPVRCLRLHLVVGEPITGVWCNTCYLPSAVRFPVYGFTVEGVTGPLGCVVSCPECQGDV